jgi:hypothetical protein
MGDVGRPGIGDAPQRCADRADDTGRYEVSRDETLRTWASTPMLQADIDDAVASEGVAI